MFDMNKSLNKMMGRNLQIPKLVSGKKSKNDLDGDGISNSKDCQKRNLTRQDSYRDPYEKKLEMKIRGREREHEQLFRVLEDKLIKSRIEHPEITAYDRVNTPYIQDLSK